MEYMTLNNRYNVDNNYKSDWSGTTLKEDYPVLWNILRGYHFPDTIKIEQGKNILKCWKNKNYIRVQFQIKCDYTPKSKPSWIK